MVFVPLLVKVSGKPSWLLLANWYRVLTGSRSTKMMSAFAGNVVGHQIPTCHFRLGCVCNIHLARCCDIVILMMFLFVCSIYSGTMLYKPDSAPKCVIGPAGCAKASQCFLTGCVLCRASGIQFQLMMLIECGYGHSGRGRNGICRDRASAVASYLGKPCSCSSKYQQERRTGLCMIAVAG